MTPAPPMLVGSGEARLSLRQLKYLKQFLSPLELKILWSAVVVAVLSLVWVVSWAWVYGLKEVPAQGGTYTEGMVGQPVHVNPLYAATNEVDRVLSKLVFAGLVAFDTRLQPVPDLAERWTVSEDQKVYTFYLRQGITWQDGTPFTAEDVLFTIESIQDDEYLSPLRSEWRGVQVSKVDDYTVTFTLTESYAPFLVSATVGIIPAHQWSGIAPLSAPLAELNLKPEGLGSWRFKSFSKDRQGVIRQYELIRNDKYHGKVPWIEELHFKMYTSIDEALMALETRNVEGVSGISADRIGRIDGRSDVVVHEFQLPQYTAVFFNQSKNESVSSVKVRTALAHAVNRERIVQESLVGKAAVAYGPILAGYPGYDSSLAAPAYDPLRAAELLDEAGWKLNPDTRIREKDGTPLTLTLTTVTQSEYTNTAALLQSYWNALGITTEIISIDSSRIQRDIIRTRSYEALLFGEIIGLDADPFPFWHSSQVSENGLNLAQFVNREADILLEKGRQLSDPEKRAEQYSAFQNIITAQVPAIFLYSPSYVYPVTKKVNGITSVRIAEPADRFNGAEFWYMETKKRW